MFTSAHHSLVQNDTKKSRVHLQAAVVLDESERRPSMLGTTRSWMANTLPVLRIVQE